VGADQCGVPGCDWRCNTNPNCNSYCNCNSDCNANRDTDGNSNSNSNRDSYIDSFDYSNLNTETYTNPENRSPAKASADTPTAPIT
jgi:hypothetical protein